MKLIKRFSILMISILVITILVLNIYKKERVFYVSFNLPDNLYGMTIPPFGILIEKQYKDSKRLLIHERVHWEQYRRMGLTKFYLTYFKEFYQYGGRTRGPMEREARTMAKQAKL